MSLAQYFKMDRNAAAGEIDRRRLKCAFELNRRFGIIRDLSCSDKYGVGRNFQLIPAVDQVSLTGIDKDIPMPEFSAACPPLHRRRLLEVGGVTALGLSLPQILAAEKSDRRRAGEKSCIFIYQYGGLSQLDSWDPKPDAPQEYRGPYRPIATKVPGFQVGELMPRLASLADKYCVIRSMSHKVPVHDIANKMLLAGNSQPAADAPSLGAIISKLKPTDKVLPNHVWLQKFGGGAAPPDPTYLTGGYLGVAQAPLLIGTQHDDNPSNPAFRMTAFDTVAGLPWERLAERRQLLAQLSQQQPTAKESQTLLHFQSQAYEMLTGPAAKEAFQIERESSALRDRYGRHPLGQNLLLARRLIESGVRLVSVVGWMGLAPGEPFVSVETWDMHGNAGIGIFENGWNGLGWALPRCDAAVATLLEDLEARGLLDSTLVVLVGEFGRTPTISKGAKAIGRDHWPNCYSAMLAGGGVQGGAIYGESDRHAAYVRTRPVSPEDFGATILHGLGIAPETRLGLDGFSKPASVGTAIREIF